MRSTHARKPASGIRYRAPGTCSASRSASSRRLASSVASRRRATRRSPARTPRPRRGRRTARCATPPRPGSAAHDAARGSSAAVTMSAHLRPGEVEGLARAGDGVADARGRGRGIQERGERDAAVRERRVDLVADHRGAEAGGEVGEGREASRASARCRWGCAGCTAARRGRRRRAPPRCRGGRAPTRRPVVDERNALDDGARLVDARRRTAGTPAA